MTLFWILVSVAYLLLNAIITLAWLSEEEYITGMTAIQMVVLIIFGLPLMTVMFLVGIIEAIKRGEM